MIYHRNWYPYDASTIQELEAEPTPVGKLLFAALESD
jgi:hypothetical protein